MNVKINSAEANSMLQKIDVVQGTNVVTKKKWVKPKLLNLNGDETKAGNTPAITEGFVFIPGTTGQS